MKQLIILVFCTIWLFSADAQSQTITGTLLPKRGTSVQYLPKVTKAQQDTNRTVNIVKPPVAVIEKHTIKTKSASKNTPIPVGAKGFVFKMPVVQGQKTESLQGEGDIQLPNKTDSAKMLSNAIQPIVQPISSAQKTTTSSINVPLKYEEPPTGQSSQISSYTGDAKSTTQLEPLVYEPPPSGNSDVNKQNQTANNTDAVKSTSLRSPTFKGEYKPSLKQPILLVPVAADQLENGVLKSKPILAAVETQKSTEPQRTIEDLYPPLNYTAPPSAAAANLKSPKIQGTYTATKNNSMILVPVVPDANDDTELPNNSQGVSINNKSNEVANQASSRTAQVAQASIFDDNRPKTITSTNNTKSQSQAAEKSIFDDDRPVVVAPKVYTKPQKQVAKPATFSNKFQKPIKQSLYNKTPIIKNKGGNFMKPVKQSVDGTSNTTFGNNQPAENTVQQDAQPSNVNYKFYLNTNGKYNIAFDEGGSNVTLTNFGRVADFYSNASIKPIYNYKGLLESVGDLKIQYTYEGRVAAVGATQIGYNYDGVIEKVGNTPIYFNSNGTVDKIGNSKVAYDEKGNITSLDKNAMILVKQ